MFLCNDNQFPSFFRSRCEWLFNDNVFPILQYQLAELEVCSWDRGDDYDVDGWVFDHFLAGAEGFDTRVVFFRVIFGCGMALHDSVEGEG